jgi:hypothetical protein
MHSGIDLYYLHDLGHPNARNSDPLRSFVEALLHLSGIFVGALGACALDTEEEAPWEASCSSSSYFKPPRLVDHLGHRTLLWSSL